MIPMEEEGVARFDKFLDRLPLECGYGHRLMTPIGFQSITISARVRFLFIADRCIPEYCSNE